MCHGCLVKSQKSVGAGCLGPAVSESERRPTSIGLSRVRGWAPEPEYACLTVSATIAETLARSKF